jgi:transposase
MTPGRLLKTDILGRVQTPVERQEALLDEFEKSGLNGKKFAAMTGVSSQAFGSWIQKRRRERGDYEKLRRQSRECIDKKEKFLEIKLQT